MLGCSYFTLYTESQYVPTLFTIIRLLLELPSPGFIALPVSVYRAPARHIGIYYFFLNGLHQ